MIDKVKLMAMYLPQYHEIPENNEFWGQGFTDWTTVKAAKQYFHKNLQPKEPMNDNYYDLSKIENIKWQVKIAKEYGIDGFCFYHYWFSSKKNILQKPAELFLADKSLDVSFCFAWDNASWKRTWSKDFGNDWAPLYDNKNLDKGKKILIQFDYEDEDAWEKHFYYLLQFFKDERYIKIQNKPVFLFWNKYQIETQTKMLAYWNKLAIDNGFDGIFFIGKYNKKNLTPIFNSEFYYEPALSAWEENSFFSKALVKSQRILTKACYPRVYSYRRTWQDLIRRAKKSKDKNVFYGAFVSYDDTPRRGANGKILNGKNARIFKKGIEKLVDISKKHNKEIIFLTAWNEWGEGAFLEPDKENGFEYLNSIKNILK
ncbi:glycoside hydrolase family 99-like domain-containing protein [Treponema bryantii]|uniref:glycosyltransferase WbsX family protein n=1 Tax=Treponema bryantii TaxID=163 RepID=UPI0003B3336C|nr:glycoside hydrolase family 99-like domain-containing protein [Treponema bryantii]